MHTFYVIKFIDTSRNQNGYSRSVALGTKDESFSFKTGENFSRPPSSLLLFPVLLRVPFTHTRCSHVSRVTRYSDHERISRSMQENFLRLVPVSPISMRLVSLYSTTQPRLRLTVGGRAVLRVPTPSRLKLHRGLLKKRKTGKRKEKFNVKTIANGSRNSYRIRFI